MRLWAIVYKNFVIYALPVSSPTLKNFFYDSMIRKLSQLLYVDWVSKK